MVLFLLGSCGAKKKTIDTREFYFPVEDFANLVVYTYASPEGNQVWYMKYEPKNRVFTTDIKLPKIAMREITNELISEKGASFIDYTVVRHDEYYEARISEKDVLKWKMSMDDDCVWKTVTPNERGDIETIKKSRQIKSVDETYEFDGIHYEAIVFKDDYEQKICDNENNQLFSRDFIQYTTYAKGIGIVRTLRIFENGDEYETYLIEIDSTNTIIK